MAKIVHFFVRKAFGILKRFAHSVIHQNLSQLVFILPLPRSHGASKSYRGVRFGYHRDEFLTGEWEVQGRVVLQITHKLVATLLLFVILIEELQRILLLLP